MCVKEKFIPRYIVYTNYSVVKTRVFAKKKLKIPGAETYLSALLAKNDLISKKGDRPEIVQGDSIISPVIMGSNPKLIHIKLEFLLIISYITLVYWKKTHQHST